MPDSSSEHWMRRAIEVAEQGLGLTRPNPPVGAVVVKNNQVIGEGWHKKAGGPHAEVYALAEAGAKAKGASIYVTLEPCSTTGRTPPCAQAIIRAGIKEVYASAVDHNPLHAGRGFDVLRQAGIKVTPGVLQEEGEELIRPWNTHLLLGRPHVTLKLGLTLDGRIADRRGKSQWITGPAARERVQELRRRSDAIMVGGETARRDNPSLIPRPARGRKPFRIVVSKSGRLPRSLKLLSDAHAERTMVVPGLTKAWLKQFSNKGITHILCEGGGQLAGQLIKKDLVDDLYLFYAPIVLGTPATAGVSGAGWNMGSNPRFKTMSTERVAEDVLIHLRRK
jgi:diaminohydroxyphosphoribosylaminopyrimidine deaminase/5-amino-6-(5-phosphoribosylamino)uracil reductase